MKIKRIVNDIEMEFELTGIELYNAYSEQQHNFDKADVEDILCDEDEVWLKERYNKTKEEVFDSIDEIAYRMRRYIDKYDCDWSYARDEAINDILSA